MYKTSQTEKTAGLTYFIIKAKSQTLSLSEARDISK